MKKLTMIICFVGLFLSPVTKGKSSVEDRLADLENTVLDLEISSLQSKIKFSGELISEGSYYDTNNSSTSSRNSERKYFANTLKLNANSLVTSNLSVYATLQGSYFYGDTLQDGNEGDYSILTRSQGDRIRIIKAYFDYGIVPGRLIFSMGRLPTINGPPQHLYVGDRRLGTYPSMAYSLPIDGIALTWNAFVSKKSEQNLTFRGIYTPVIKMDRESPWTPADARSSFERTGYDAENDTLYSFMMEYDAKNVSFIKGDLLFILQYYHAGFKNFKSRSQRMRLPGVGGSMLFDLYLDNEKMLTVDTIAGYLELNRIFKTNFDFYATYKISNSQGHANIIGKIIDSGDSGLPVDSEQSLGAYWIDGTKTGSGILTGLRHSFSRKWSWGAEFLYNSLGSFQTTFYSHRMTDFYYTIGKGAHFHIDYSVKRDLFNIVLGYSNVLTDWEFDLASDLAHSRSRMRREQLYLLGRIKF